MKMKTTKGYQTRTERKPRNSQISYPIVYLDLGFAMAGKWARNLTVETEENGGVAHIQSTEDAAYYLLDRWRRERSAAYCSAVRMCAKAIRGEVSHEGAYISFMALVREANLALVSHPKYEEIDDFVNEIGMVIAENILSDLKGLWLHNRPDHHVSRALS